MTSTFPKTRKRKSKRCAPDSCASSKRSGLVLPLARNRAPSPDRFGAPSPNSGPLEVRAHAGRTVPVLVDYAAIVEHERALALLRGCWRADRDTHADADSHAAATAADSRAAKADADARARLRDGLRHPGVPVPSVRGRG